MGAKSGQSEKSAGRQRLALVLFGGLLAVLFAIVAVAQGITQPSVPSGDVALVEDLASGTVTVSEEEFERAFAQQVAQSEQKKAPKEGSERYEELREAAFGELLDIIWLAGEAEELGIPVPTDKQVADELEQIKEQSFPTPKAYKEFLERTKFTQEDVETRVKLQLYSTQIQELIAGQAGQASNEEIKEFYETAKDSQYTIGPTRDIRIVTNKDRGEVEEAAAALGSDSSPANWKKVAKKYSEDPSSSENGGLQEGLSEEILPEPLKADIFQAATGELIGPVRFQGNFTLVEVVKVNAGKTQTLGEVRAQIQTQLNQQIQQEALTEFIAGYQSKWTSRTFCAEEFRGIERCANFKGSGRPPTAAPACYEAEPKEGPPTECPAPVTQLAPALPGSVSLLQPQGERLPQRPVLEGSAEGEEEGLEGLEGIEGLEEGAPPEAPAPSGE